MRYTSKTVRALTSVAAMAATLGACGDFFTVTNQGPIEDENLRSVAAVPGFVGGMSGDLSNALDEMVRITAITTDELAHGGSYTGEGLWFRGIINKEDINNQWALMQRARWVAESGIERMKTVAGFAYDTDPLAARANLLAGFSNRLQGENNCQAVVETKPAQPNRVHFERAEAYFTEAIRIGGTRSTTADIVNAAYGGRAQVRVHLGNWAGAVTDAAIVPPAFSYVSPFSLNSTRENNSVVQETWVRREFTVFGTPWARVFNDPRVPWDTLYTNTTRTVVQKGQDGKTNFFRQRKYTDLGADIPLARGTEMLMIRAEDALRAGDIARAFGFINQQRTQNRVTPALVPPATLTEAWRTLQSEAGATVWIEARRLGQFRRWSAAPAGDPSRITFLDGRSSCVPISLDELQSNPALR